MTTTQTSTSVRGNFMLFAQLPYQLRVDMARSGLHNYLVMIDGYRFVHTSIVKSFMTPTAFRQMECVVSTLMVTE